MKKLSLFASATLFATSMTYAGGDAWMTDFEAAKAKAAKEHKDLLIDFTGSDWCHWCVKLKEEVFDHDSFTDGVADKYVLVELDYPKDKSKQDEKTIKQNEELRATYPVKGFPTILLTDAQGRPYAQTGYQKGGPEVYLTHLGEIQQAKSKRDEALAAAGKAEGPAKVEALMNALKQVPETYRLLYPEITNKIIELDPADKTGIAAQIKAEAAKMKFEGDLQAAMKSRDSAAASRIVDDHIAAQNLEGEEKQKFLAIKINAYLGAQDFEGVEKVIEEIIAVAPDSQIAKGVEQFRTGRLPQIKAQAMKKKEQ